MSLIDELVNLHKLYESGGLTAEEYARAKAALLADAPTVAAGAPPPPVHVHYRPPNDALGNAAQTWVMFQIIWTIGGLVVAGIIFLVFFLPKINNMRGG